MKDKIKVLYIAGATRSGSTLLARLLGEVDNFISIGEAFRWMFNTERMSRTQPCGCGSSVLECHFWREIVAKIENSREQELGTSYIRIRYLPLLMSPVKTSLFNDSWNKLLIITQNIIEAISKKSNNHVIVDSSKNPANAYVLSQVPGVELHVVHLVRDPRGVVSSWSRPKKYLSTYPTHTVIGWWLSHNMSAEVLRFCANSFMQLRYEDFLENPKETLRNILCSANENPKDIDIITDDSVRIGVQHLLAGNPDKMQSGEIKIKPRKWHLNRFRTIVTTLLTFPLLIKYNYPLRISKQ